MKNFSKIAQKIYFSILYVIIFGLILTEILAYQIRKLRSANQTNSQEISLKYLQGHWKIDLTISQYNFKELSSFFTKQELIIYRNYIFFEGKTYTDASLNIQKNFCYRNNYRINIYQNYPQYSKILFENPLKMIKIEALQTINKNCDLSSQAQALLEEEKIIKLFQMTKKIQILENQNRLNVYLRRQISKNQISKIKGWSFQNKKLFQLVKINN